MPVHFEWIGNDGAKTMEGNSKESYNSLEELSERCGNSGSSIEVESMPNTVKGIDVKVLDGMDFCFTKEREESKTKVGLRADVHDRIKGAEGRKSDE